MSSDQKGVVTYQPKAVKDGKFTGHVKVRLLTFDERYDLLEKAALADEGKAANVKFMREIVAASKPRYVEVDLKRLADGAEFKSVADLDFGIDCHAILFDVANGLLQDFDAGNG